jgi:hypothetical protein
MPALATLMLVILTSLFSALAWGASDYSPFLFTWGASAEMCISICYMHRLSCGKAKVGTYHTGITESDQRFGRGGLWEVNTI